MRILVAAAAASLCLATAALAASPEMEATFGNTVVLTDADGNETTFVFSEDGTVVRGTADGEVEGTWEETDGVLCTTFEEEICWEMAPGKVAGDSWDQEDPDGNAVTIAIVEGTE